MKPKKTKLIKVLEVSQHVATGNIEDFTFADFDVNKVKGGDSEAGRIISGGYFHIFKVDENARPLKGYIWYRAGKNGKLELYKTNPDTSD
jgi:hypothetical protein